MLVFGGPLSPLGWKIGFLRKPRAEVKAATATWYERLDKDGVNRHEFVALSGVPFLEALSSLAPLQTPPKRELLVETDSDWTAHFMNTHLGGDSVSWAGYLSGVLSCEAVVASHIPPEQYPYPSTQFELIGPQGVPPLRYVRTLTCGKYDSGRWEFLAHGEIQAFEEPRRYEERLKRSRFDRELLLRYLAALGIRPDDPGFWRESTRIDTLAPWHSRESSLEETQRDYGIRP